MSSSEEYLDSLLESILNGGKSQNVDSTPVQQNVTADDIAGELPEDSVAQKTTANANKAMSTEEIEEMLMSMGTLGGETKMPAEDESIGVVLLADTVVLLGILMTSLRKKGAPAI